MELNRELSKEKTKLLINTLRSAQYSLLLYLQ